MLKLMKNKFNDIRDENKFFTIFTCCFDYEKFNGLLIFTYFYDEKNYKLAYYFFIDKLFLNG
jgi:hypothetical protein